MSRNLITDHYYRKSSNLFRAVTKLKNAGIAIHTIDFDTKRINVERPTPEQVFKLGVTAILAVTSGRSETTLNGFVINWEATKQVIEIKITKGVVA